MNTTRIAKHTRILPVDSRVKELRRALDRDPYNIYLRLRLAAALENGGKFDESLKVLEDTIEKARRNLGVAYCTLAAGLMKLNKPDEALRDFDVAVELDPLNSAFYLSNKAAALNQIGLTDKAKSLYEEMLQRRDLAKETRRIVVSNLKNLAP